MIKSKAKPLPRRVRRCGSGFALGALTATLLLAMLEMQVGASAQPAPTVLPDVPASATDQRAPAANNSPSLVADPTEPRFVVAAHRLDAPGFGCALQVSGDGGAGWISVDPVPVLPDGAEACYAPEVVFDRHGLLYYLFVGLQGQGNEPIGAFLTTSADHGRTFSTPWRVLGPQRYMVRLAIDPSVTRRGRLHLVWLDVNAASPLGGLPSAPNPILAAHSDDGGLTFSDPVPVSETTRPRAVAPSLTFGADHTVYVAFYDLQDDARDYQGLEGPPWEGTWSLVVARSTDRGTSFQPGAVVTDKIVPRQRVMLIYTMPPASIASDPAGRLYTVWEDSRRGSSDVYLADSRDHGRSWSPPVRLNDDPPESVAEQYLPHIAVAPNGRVDVVFLDRRDDAENLRNDVYYTFSTTGGAQFSPNMKLSTRSSDSRFGQLYLVPSAVGLVDFGSRLGLLATDDRTLAAWPDTRNVVSAGSRQQDLFTAEVVRPPTAGHRGGRLGILARIGLAMGLATALVLGAGAIHRGRSSPRES